MYYKNRVIATNSWRNDPRGKDKAKQKVSPHAHTTQKKREDWRPPMWCESTNQSQGCSNFQLQKSPLLLSTRGRARQQRTAPLPRIDNKKLLTTSQRKVNKMGNFQLKLVLLLFTVCAALSTLSTAQDFKCSAQTAARCQALVGYLPPNKTTISEIQSLFTVKNLRSILGANNFPPGTPRNFSVPAQKPIKVPIHCICSNGTGAFLFPLSLSSDDTPPPPPKKNQKKEIDKSFNFNFNLISHDYWQSGMTARLVSIISSVSSSHFTWTLLYMTLTCHLCFNWLPIIIL